MQRLKSLLSFIKFEHTLFSLPLIYSGVFLAAHQPPALSLIILVFLASVGARTVALSLNRLIDLEIDKRNPRTTGRELPSGRLKIREAGAILGVSLMLYFVSAGLISSFCLYLSPIPLVIFTFYPYMKRFTAMAHLGVGVGLSMAPLGGWFAVAQSFQNILPGALLSLFTLFWVSGFDIIYSTLDELFDRQENLHSFSSKFGKQKALKISAYFHAAAFVALGLLFVVYIKAVAALPFLVVSGYLLYLEHKSAEDVEFAFFRVNAALGFVVLGMVVAGVYFP